MQAVLCLRPACALLCAVFGSAYLLRLVLHANLAPLGVTQVGPRVIAAAPSVDVAFHG